MRKKKSRVHRSSQASTLKNVIHIESRGIESQGSVHLPLEAPRGTSLLDIKKPGRGKKQNARGYFDARKQRGDPDGAFR